MPTAKSGKGGSASGGGEPPSGAAGAGTPTFEEAIEQVEQLIDRIERGEQGLERSIADYERGAALLKKCREILARSEQRIQEIEADLSSAGGAPGRGTPSSGSKQAGSTSPPVPPDDGDDTPF